MAKNGWKSIFRGVGVKFGSKTENIQNFFGVNIRLTYSGLPLHFDMSNENKNHTLSIFSHICHKMYENTFFRAPVGAFLAQKTKNNW